MSDEIVGHKTFSTGDPLQPFRHEPLTRAEADALFAAAEAAKAKRATDMPTEEDAVRAMWSAFQRLRDLGWREACYAPTDSGSLNSVTSGRLTRSCSNRPMEIRGVRNDRQQR